jgi:hypothetical protein
MHDHGDRKGSAIFHCSQGMREGASFRRALGAQKEATATDAPEGGEILIQPRLRTFASRESSPVLSIMLFLIMDQHSAKRGNSRDLRASQTESFLAEALAGGKMSVAALDERARAAGLVDEHQSITDLKLFKSAKRSMGIRSRRVGFGPGAVWFWTLPIPPSVAVTTVATEPPDVDVVDLSDHTPAISPCYPESIGWRPDGVPVEWTRGVAILQLRPRPSGIPGHRWRLFVDDVKRFIGTPQAEHAAQLGWDIAELLGSHYETPHEHLGSSGLLWNLAGGQIVQIHVDGADLLAADGRLRRFQRRPIQMMVFHPWQ